MKIRGNFGISFSPLSQVKNKIRNARIAGSSEVKSAEKKLLEQTDKVFISKNMQASVAPQEKGGSSQEVSQSKTEEKAEKQVVEWEKALLDTLSSSSGEVHLSEDAYKVNFEFLDALNRVSKVYPDITERICKLESEALEKGYDPSQTPVLEKKVLAEKPWSSREWPTDKLDKYVAARKAADPRLNSTDVKYYDFERALEVKDKVLGELSSLFPKDKHPGITVVARAKTPESLAGKIKSKRAKGLDYTLGDATDLVGARIIADKMEDLKVITEAIEKKYGGVIQEKTNYYEHPKGPYRAIHYIVDIDGQPTEIQVSTKRMRVSFDAYHDTVYKEDPNHPLSEPTKKRFGRLVDQALYLDCREFLEAREGPTANHLKH